MRRKLIPYTMPDGRRPAGRFSVILSAVLAVAVIVLGGLNVYQYFSVSAQAKKLKEVEQSLSSAKANYAVSSRSLDDITAVLNSQVDQLENVTSVAGLLYLSVRYVPEGSNVYHRYNCPNLEGASRYYIMNPELASSLGYVPCAECEDINSQPCQEFVKKTTSILDLANLIQKDDFFAWHVYAESVNGD